MSRVLIASNFKSQPRWKLFIGVPLIYLPLLTTLPFVALGALLVWLHLRLAGGKQIKSYWDFVPQWVSHRYRYKEQIVYHTGARWYNLRSSRLYWIFNCELYCPLSVALFRYMVYLVMIVENWWCPFKHDQKAHYCTSSIDASYWHLYDSEMEQLHPDDRDNPIWNEAAKGCKKPLQKSV